MGPRGLVVSVARALLPQNVCHTLWCFVGLTCHSKLDAAVDGTTCGESKVQGPWPAGGRGPRPVVSGLGASLAHRLVMLLADPWPSPAPAPICRMEA